MEGQRAGTVKRQRPHVEEKHKAIEVKGQWKSSGTYMGWKVEISARLRNGVRDS